MMEKSTGRGPTRDRDAAGRPRNARPRDALGRPLHRGAHGVAPLDESRARNSTETIHEAQELLNSGHPFQAHEVLELRWNRCPESERELWQALAQLAVGVTHALRGNNVGAHTLLNRAHTRLSRYQGPVPEGFGVAGVVQWLDAAAAEVDRNAATTLKWFADVPPPLA